MNESKKPLYWHQGLFLQPQHFQQFDLYVQSLLTPFYSYQMPYFWGVKNINIQESALQQRVFEIQQAEVIFQDRTWAAFPGNALIQPRSFEDVPLDLEGENPFRIYLGIRKWNQVDKNVTPTKATDDLGALGTRYQCPMDPEDVKDLHHDGPSANVRFMNFVLKLFWETEIEDLGEYWLIPIAQLELEGTEIHLSPNFIPPTFVLSGSGVLIQMMRGIVEQVTSRSRALEPYKLSRDFQTSGTEGNYMRYQLALTALNRYASLLHHMMETPLIHPWVVYGLLRQMIGELSSYTERIDALGRLMDGTPLLPNYDHKNLYTCFNEAHTLINELLGAIIVGGENIVHLVREKIEFQGQIPLEAITDRNIFCLVVKTAADPDQIVSAFVHIAKVGSLEEMPTLLARALTGVPVDHRSTPPPGIPRRPDSLYFLLDRTHPQWQEIKRTGNICLHWDDAPEDATVDLVISPI